MNAPSLPIEMAGESTASPDAEPSKYREMSRESVSRSTPPRGPRRSFLPYVVLTVVTFLVTWFIFATITGLPVGLGPSPASKSSSGPTTGVILSIDNPFDTAMNATTDQYAPANFSVPADTLLEFTLINFDTGQNPVTNPLWANANGTVGNCIYLNATPTSLGPCEHSVPIGFIAHTFSFESGPYSGFNVPVPSAAAASEEGSPGASVTFFAYFNTTGTFTWNCLAPCDPYSMMTDGFMTGTMTVTPP
jgi:hypothetical protein